MKFSNFISTLAMVCLALNADALIIKSPSISIAPTKQECIEKINAIKRPYEEAKATPNYAKWFKWGEIAGTETVMRNLIKGGAEGSLNAALWRNDKNLAKCVNQGEAIRQALIQFNAMN